MHCERDRRYFWDYDNTAELALSEHIKGRDHLDNQSSDNGTSLAFSVSYSYLIG